MAEKKSNEREPRINRIARMKWLQKRKASLEVRSVIPFSFVEFV
jgi:hypothetical protein